MSVLISYDADDFSMTDEIVARAKALHASVVAVKGNSPTKIAACNADLKNYPANWDVLLLVSDDMICCQDGWDASIQTNMERYYPDTAGALWFYDGNPNHVGSLNTLECVGRQRYERFGYVYHPAYASFYCDNENTEVGIRDGRLTYVPEPICIHENPHAEVNPHFDDTYVRNGKFFERDTLVYRDRKAEGFPVGV